MKIGAAKAVLYERRRGRPAGAAVEDTQLNREIRTGDSMHPIPLCFRGFLSIATVGMRE